MKILAYIIIPLCHFIPIIHRVFGAIIFGGIVVGRNSSFGVDYVKAKLAAGRIISLINRKPKVDVRDPSGEKLVSVSQFEIVITEKCNLSNMEPGNLF